MNEFVFFVFGLFFIIMFLLVYGNNSNDIWVMWNLFFNFIINEWILMKMLYSV